jgi:hypothetical protein
VTEPTKKDRERADDLAEYLAEFTSGKGYTEADCIFDALQDTRKDERARIVASLRAAGRPRGPLHEVAAFIESGKL